MHLRFSDTAEKDLDKIYKDRVTDNPEAAQRMVDNLLSASYQLESFPFMGREGRVSNTRELSVPRTPFILVYTLPDQYHIDLETIIHERQQYP